MEISDLQKTHTFKPRRSDFPFGMESDRDYLTNNADLAVELLRRYAEWLGVEEEEPFTEEGGTQ